MLILGFFGIGKTTAKNEIVADLTDLGSPSLSLLEDTVRKYDIVLADPMWEKVFLESGMPFTVVVPSLDRKEEFLGNFRERVKKGLGGGNELFCKVIGDNWDGWITHFLSLPVRVVELQEGEWISDYISLLSARQTH